MRSAVPHTPPPPEPNPMRKYRILSGRCVWGARGEVVEMAFTPGEELSLLEAGTLERVPDEPSGARKDRPLKSAEKEG